MATPLRLVMVVLALLFGTAAPAFAQADQASVVNHALSTIERMKTDYNFQTSFQEHLDQAKAVLIIPNLYKGGFLLGGQYGNGVLLAKGADGQWSYPAFYSITGGSLGLQIGLESSAILFMIQTEKGLNSVLSSQFKIGADAGLTVVVFGGGLNASTTPTWKADIVAFALSGVGLYGGLSLEGTTVSPRESWNRAYYGQSLTARAIVLENAASNPQADRLRDYLATR